jgi:hypothetical protein
MDVHGEVITNHVGFNAVLEEVTASSAAITLRSTRKPHFV